MPSITSHATWRAAVLATVALVILPLGTLVATARAATARSAVDSNGGQANTWVPTAGAMSVARAGQTATLLSNGKVLIVGGAGASAELYDPSTRTFAPTGSMSVARPGATATLLPDGDVLVAGGCCRAGFVNFSSAELYDPSTGTWSLTGSMVHPRAMHTATLLPDGEVLVAGGACNGENYGCDSGSFLVDQRTAELYDPTTGTWTATGSMSDGRDLATATLLRNGEVLVAGGFNSCDDDLCSDLAESELYNPETGKWTKTGAMLGPREQHSATLLSSGLVLVAGGLNDAGFGSGVTYSSAELYDPAAGTWTLTASMTSRRYGQTATLLKSGWVLVAGGQSSAAEIYEPARGIWVPSAAMSTARTDATATLLGDGHVLVTGGSGSDDHAQRTAEVYLAGPGPLVSLSPSAVTFGAQQVGSTSPVHSVTVTNNGSGALKVLGVTVSGADPGDFLAASNCNVAPVPAGWSCTVSVRFFPSATNLRSATIGLVDNAPLSPQSESVSGYGGGGNVWVPTGSMTGSRDEATATLLRNGNVLVVGGENGPLAAVGTAELYNPATHAFSSTGSLNVTRAYATAALLHNGDVLVAGGLGGPNDTDLSSAELYDPARGSWTLTGAMNLAGYALTSTLLPSGNVLVTGLGYPSGAEVYDPTSGTWADTAPMVGGGFGATATLLRGGEVLVAGGATTAAGLYDPATDTWTATGSLQLARQRSTATLLPDGQVLVAGGEVPDGGNAIASSELYHPATGTWAMTNGPMSVARFAHFAALLPNGQVLVAGGCTASCGSHTVTATSEIFDPASGYWYYGDSMTEARFASSATVLSNGDLLVAGGSNYCCKFLASAELYTPTQLAATPANGSPGQSVSLQGSGFFASETVQITWDERPLASARTSSDGGFTATITIPPGSSGTHTIRAQGKTSFASASVIFRVTG